ncbi:hypothetical protein V8E53_008339 [Lactarius tabidus]
MLLLCWPSSTPDDRGAPGAASLLADTPHPQTPAGMTATITPTRKRAVSAEIRPVNIIQHDDAGPSEGPASAGEPETIELPRIRSYYSLFPNCY